MKIAFLHFHHSDEKQKKIESGVTRYGRLLAKTFRDLNHETEEKRIVFASSFIELVKQVVQALPLRKADMLFLQISPFFFRTKFQKRFLFLALPLFFRNYRVVLHDANYYGSFFTARALIEKLFYKASRKVFVFQESQKKAFSFLKPQQISVVPHFVEPRSLGISNAEAKRKLNLTGKKVLTVLGFISPRKNQKMAVEALSLLPDDYFLILAGMTAPRCESYTEELQDYAAEAGVSERLSITGFISESDLNTYLAATDLALCPFLHLSASGSFSTWLSANRPLLVSDIPEFRREKIQASEGLELFDPSTPEALANAIRSFFSSNPAFQNAVNPLAELYNIKKIAGLYLEK